MIDPEDQHLTSFIQHVAKSEPQKDPGRLIFDRHLATVDAPRQTISKVIGLVSLPRMRFHQVPMQSMKARHASPSKRWHNALHMRIVEVLQMSYYQNAAWS